MIRSLYSFFFFFNDTATTEIYTLSLHDALPILIEAAQHNVIVHAARVEFDDLLVLLDGQLEDRKSTRLNSSHQIISYAVFCLKKKKNTIIKKENDSQNIMIITTANCAIARWFDG